MIFFIGWVLAVFATTMVIAAVIDSGHAKEKYELRQQLNAAKVRNKALRSDVALWRLRYRLLKSEHEPATPDQIARGLMADAERGSVSPSEA